MAYFDQKSTVDYIGAVQGVPVCFDAKECAVSTFPLQNVHAHQVEFMREFEAQGGVAFIILYFTSKDEMYYIPFTELDAFWSRMQKGGKEKALHMRNWINRGKLEASATFMSTIWSRFRETWS